MIKFTNPLNIIRQRSYISILLFFRHVSHDRYALKDLETIDDDLDHIGIILVRLADENGAFADKHELDMVPALMLFHESRPHQYKGTSINHVDSFWDFFTPLPPCGAFY